MQRRHENIGLVAVGARTISSGMEYSGLIPSPDYEQTVLKQNGSIDETVHFMAGYIKKYRHDTVKLALLLNGNTTRASCENIWNFVYKHIQYKLDKEGEEQLRRPAMLWADRVKGGDCDCMTIFVCTVLCNLNIPFNIRITKYDGKSYFQHVYPIVPLETGGYYTIDCFVSKFNYEKPFSEKKDYTMASLGIPIIGLHGITPDIEHLIHGLGATDDTEQAVYDHLVATRDIVRANVGIISKIDYEPAFLEMLDYAIRHFWSPTRDEAFKHLAWNEAIHNQQSGVEEDDLLGFDDEQDETLLGIDDLDGIVDGDDVYEFDGLGRTKTSRKDRKAKRKQQKAEKKIRKASKTKNSNKAARKLRKAEKKIAKGFFRKTGVVLANKAHKRALLKHNPVLIAQQESAETDEEVQDENPIVDDANNTDDSASEQVADTTGDESADETTTDDEQVADENEPTDEVDSNEATDENVEGLLGLSKVPQGKEQEIYKHLVATRNILIKHPDLIQPHIDYTPGFLDMLDYAIKHFWTPQRDEALRVLAVNEAKMNKVNGVSEDDLLGADEETIDGIVDYDNVYDFDGLGELGDKNKRKQLRAERKAENKANKDKNKAERKHAKGFFRKIGVSLKQGTKTFMKFNPALIAMRNSFLLVMKINLFNFSAKAKWGYATPEQAKAAGISDDKYKKSKKFIAQLEKLFVEKSGGSKVSLKRNILASKKARLGEVINLSGPEAAPIIAALPLIAAVVKMLKENGLLSKKEADDIDKKVKNKDLVISDDDAKEIDTIAKEEAATDKTAADDPAKDGSGGDEKSILTTIWEKTKEHPVLAISTLVLCTYLFIPPVRNYVNGLIKMVKKPKQLSGNHVNTLEGIGKTTPIKTKTTAKPQKLTFINLK